MTVIAVDPGKNGGIARMNETDTKVWPMPATEHDLVELLGSEIGNVTDHHVVVYCEQVGGFTGGPAPGSHMFNFGWWASGPVWIAACYNARTVLIRPQKWQKEMSLGSGGKGQRERTIWKNKLKAVAQRLHPDLLITLKTADAVLILEAALKIEGIKRLTKGR